MSDLPPALAASVAKFFQEADRQRAGEILVNYAERFAKLKDLERVRLDMVFVSKGNLEKLARQAERDYRDVIMAAEYELRDGKIVKRTSFE
jgi:hypothetical protein